METHHTYSKADIVAAMERELGAEHPKCSKGNIAIYHKFKSDETLEEQTDRAFRETFVLHNSVYGARIDAKHSSVLKLTTEVKKAMIKSANDYIQRARVDDTGLNIGCLTYLSRGKYLTLDQQNTLCEAISAAVAPTLMSVEGLSFSWQTRYLRGVGNSGLNMFGLLVLPIPEDEEDEEATEATEDPE